jgi:hypothetical protein
MRMSAGKWFRCTGLAASLLALASCGRKAEMPAAEAPAAPASEQGGLFDTAVDAYVFGYPLVTMEYTRRVMTNVAAPEGTRAPMGQLVRLREYPNASFRDVTAPNADTLYTTAWIDVSREPWVLSLPDMKARYDLFPLLDGWTNVFQVPGKRTTGTAAQVYAITGPGWTGTLPADVEEYKSPTAIVWLLGRIYCTGTPEDYNAVHAVQDKVSIVPLSSFGKPYTPPAGTVDSSIDMKKPVRDMVDDLHAGAYFETLANLLKSNPPSAADAPMVERLAALGIVPGQELDAGKLRTAVGPRLLDVPKTAQGKVMEWVQGAVPAGDAQNLNGWFFSTKTGTYGTNYIQRALITAVGLGANLPQDAVYPTSEVDADGKPYTGANKYVLRFEKDQVPPVDGFWSLTMYDGSYFFVENPLHRYTVSSRNRFVPNADGSVDIYIQNESPGKAKEANWLPAPRDKFILMMRLYWPKETPPSLLDGTWKIPGVKQAA